MRARLSVILAIAMIFAVTGCKEKPLCPIQVKVRDVVSQDVFGALAACKGQVAVKRDVGAFLQRKLNLCTEDGKMQAGPITTIVCPILGELAKVYPGPAINGKFPVDWECDASVGVGKAVDALTFGCMLLPF